MVQMDLTSRMDTPVAFADLEEGRDFIKFDAVGGMTTYSKIVNPGSGPNAFNYATSELETIASDAQVTPILAKLVPA